MKYLGRKISHSHKFDNWKSKKQDGYQCVRKETLIDVQRSRCPVVQSIESQDVKNNEEHIIHWWCRFYFAKRQIL